MAESILLATVSDHRFKLDKRGQLSSARTMKRFPSCAHSPRLFQAGHPSFRVSVASRHAFCAVRSVFLALAARIALSDCGCRDIGRTQSKEGI
jgi:hypothetical protein